MLLVLTVGDYLLWDWSIANAHDIVSLVAGLTLVPLAAVSLVQLALASGRLLGGLIGASRIPNHAGRASHGAQSVGGEPRSSTTESHVSSGKLAA
jgi:hypothetical protein